MNNNSINFFELTNAIKSSIVEFKNWEGHENLNGFSINISVENNLIDVDCCFSDDYSKTIMFFEGTDIESTDALYNLDEKVISRVADAMIDNNFISYK